MESKGKGSTATVLQFTGCRRRPASTATAGLRTWGVPGEECIESRALRFAARLQSTNEPPRNGARRAKRQAGGVAVSSGPSQDSSLDIHYARRYVAEFQYGHSPLPNRSTDARSATGPRSQARRIRVRFA